MTGYVAYVPVFEVPRVTTYDEKGDRRYDLWGRSLTWWRETDYYRHDWVLTSPQAHWGKDVRREMLVEDDRTHIFFDSGGFMVGVGKFPGMEGSDFPVIGANAFGGVTSAIDVSRWYERNARKGDPCMILDAPSWQIDPKLYAQTNSPTHSTVQGTEEEFERALTKTVKNAEKMLELRRGNYDLFGVVQGAEPRLMDRWFNRLKRTGDFDGWAFSAKFNPAVYVMVLALGHHYSPNKPFHILGHGGATMFCLAAYVANKTNNRITTDSSTATRMSSGYQWYIPGTLKPFFVGGRTDWPDVPCDCPVCSYHGPDDFFSGIYEAKSLLTLHNLYQILGYVKLVNAVKGDREALERIAPKEVPPLLDALDYYFDHGLDALIRKAGDPEKGKRMTFASIARKFSQGQTTLEEHDPTDLGMCNLCRKNPAEKEFRNDGNPEPLFLCSDCHGRLAVVR